MATATELSVNTSVTALDMANAIFGDGVTVVSATLSGDTQAAGIYSGALGTIPGISPTDSGVILSTGKATDFTNSSGTTDTNTASNTSTDLAGGIEGDSQLNTVAGAATHDGTILTAQFIPDGDMITMQFVFSSEEYPEYVHAGFNDAFGVWVNGTFVPATITTTGEVSIDTVNATDNKNLYISNATDAFNTEMDGFTVVLSFKAPVTAGQVNTIKIGIADAGDSVYDSNLLIMGDSIQTYDLAIDDKVQLTANASRTFDLLANDRDASDGGLTITKINGVAVTAGQTVTLATGETVTLNADGTVTILADADIGSNNFTYEVTDIEGNTDTGYVTVKTVSATAKDGIVQGSSGGDVIDTAYTGDPDGDRIDANDALGIGGTTGDGDYVLAGAGNDTVSAGAGNDVIYAGTGDDSVSGGAANDFADLGTGNDSFGTAADDAGNDTVYGDAGSDTIAGGAGNDLAYGGDDADSLSGGAGSDTLYGDDGSDTLAGGGEADTLYGGTGADSLAGGAGTDSVEGGAGNDTLTGGGSNDNLYGGDDADRFVADLSDTSGGANWTVYGGSGGLDADTLDLTGLQASGWVITNVTRNAETNGSPGFNGQYQLYNATLGISAVVNYHDIEAFVANGGPVDGTSSGEVMGPGYADAQYDQIDGSDGLNDTVYGNGGADQIDAGAGDDTVYGGTGNDTLTGGSAGNDVLRGDEGDDRFTVGGGSDSVTGGEAAEVAGDTLDASAQTAGLTLTYSGAEAGSLSGTGVATSFAEIEKVVLGAGADVVDATLASGGVNALAGAGNDVLTGGAGADSLAGGDDADTFHAGANDVVDGGEGGDDNDTLVLTNVTRLVFDAGTTEAGTATFADGSTMTFTGIEHLNLNGGHPDGFVNGTGGDDYMPVGYVDGNGDIIDGNDAIFSDALPNDDGIFGGAGNDTAFGGEGKDFVFGGTGQDSLHGGTGHDTMQGDEDSDTLHGDDGNDYVRGDAGDDTVYGDGGDDSVYGGLNDDIVYGGDGNDFTYGGYGNDIVYGEIGDDTMTGSDGDDAVYGGEGNDSVLGSQGNDTLYGGVGADTLQGENDADVIYGGSGDIVTGGEGFTTGTDNDTLYVTDVASYWLDPGNPEHGTVTFNDGGTLTFYEIENLYVNGVKVTLPDYVVEGGDGGDLIDAAYTGDPEGDRIDAADNLAGNNDDLVRAGGGNDTVASGAGADVVEAGTGDDLVDGGTGDDRLSGEAGADTLAGGSGNDQLSGGADGDSLSGGGDDDTLSGDGGNDTLAGDAGNDLLAGGAGADLATGGAGDDRFVLTGGFGNDTLTGGETAETSGDVLDLTGLTGSVTVNLSAANAETGSVSQGGDTASFTEIEAIQLGDATETLVLADGSGADRVQGFAAPILNPDGSYTGRDLLNVAGLHDAGGSPVTVQDVVVADDGQGNARLTFPNGESLVLVGVSASSVSSYAALKAMGIPVAPDYVVEGTASGELIDTNYTGDPEGDRVDNADNQTGTDDDVIEAYDGDDTVRAGAGNDHVDAGSGADSVEGGTGADTVLGGAGNDLILGQDGADVLDGGANDDVLVGGAGADTLIGGAGVDSMYGGADADSISAGDGNDLVLADEGDDSVEGGAGQDTLYAGEGNDTLLGGDGADYADGSDGDDSVEGGEGNDTLVGGSGSDALYGGAGDDSLNGGTGGDTIDGGAGADDIQGYTGDDSLTGGTDADTITAHDGDDTVAGGDGADQVFAGEGNDLIYGDNADGTGSGADQILTGAGNDTAFGGDGNDLIYGEGGNDVITGGAGADTLAGGDDRDTFYGGGGDQIDGNEGGDDQDVLDLTAWGHPATEIHYDPLNHENGTVDFLDAEGKIISTLTFQNIEKVIACFTPGTRILAEGGEIAVEDLVPGDRVLTRDNGWQELRWIGRRDLSAGDLAAEPRFAPVRIEAGALGLNLPARALTVSPQHRLLVVGPRAELLFGEHEVLVPALHLVGQPGISRLAPEDGVSYLHLLFDAHEIISSEGAWSESFQPGLASLGGLDDDCRREILDLFPDILDPGIYPPARMTLKAREVRVLFAA